MAIVGERPSPVGSAAGALPVWAPNGRINRPSRNNLLRACQVVIQGGGGVITVRDAHADGVFPLRDIGEADSLEISLGVARHRGQGLGILPFQVGHADRTAGDGQFRLLAFPVAVDVLVEQHADLRQPAADRGGRRQHLRRCG